MKRRLRSRATKPVSDAPLAALTAAWLRTTRDPAAAKTSEVIPPREAARPYDAAMKWAAFSGFVAALGLVLGIGSTGSAAPFTWEIEGQVEQILSCSATCNPVDRPELTSLGVVVGAPLRANYVLESGAPDMDALPDYGRYTAILSASFQIAGYSVSASVFPTGADLVVNVPYQAMLLLVSYGDAGPSTLSNPIVGLEVLADVPGTLHRTRCR